MRRDQDTGSREVGRQSAHTRAVDGLDVGGKKEAGAPGCRPPDGEAWQGDGRRF